MPDLSTACPLCGSDTYADSDDPNRRYCRGCGAMLQVDEGYTIESMFPWSGAEGDDGDD